MAILFEDDTDIHDNDTVVKDPGGVGDVRFKDRTKVRNNRRVIDYSAEGAPKSNNTPTLKHKLKEYFGMKAFIMPLIGAIVAAVVAGYILWVWLYG
ncbi:hypothetical protein ACUNV4_29410 [Granulosicoccus sp. 3-233]|uniref:hypothetical protein n=1 Tax=Granulosicoccus sp. 3-233 TaxID=3417969 RepID=UPI003D346CC4